ncbi:hypothetical protein HDV02_002022 [Globomyces sp. JEL0801]|nr:hypothetical protein HDV02_002022 [Globomyces sp. JEL0801]
MTSNVNTILDALFIHSLTKSDNQKTISSFNSLVAESSELYLNELTHNHEGQLHNSLRPIGADGILVLFDLCLGCLHLSNALVLSNAPFLKILNLGFNNITDEGLQHLSRFIHKSQTLEELDLVDNNITHIGMNEFATALINNKSLKTLVLSRNELSDEGITLLANSLKTTQLETLAIDATGILLEGNSISDEGAIQLANSLKTNKSLRTLVLEENLIGDLGAISFANSISVNTTLTDLRLCDNLITQSGAKALLDSIKLNQSVQLDRLRNPDYSYPELLAIDDQVLSELYIQSKQNFQNRKNVSCTLQLMHVSRKLLLLRKI